MADHPTGTCRVCGRENTRLLKDGTVGLHNWRKGNTWYNDGRSDRCSGWGKPPKATYAWCFSHGLLHTFPVGADPWCTGNWVSLSNQFEEAALEKKVAYYGGAAFLEDLPYETKLEVLEIGDTRD